LTGYTRKCNPLAWAGTQDNLGLALWRLGEREHGTERLEETEQAYQGALEVFQQADAAYYVNQTTKNLQLVREEIRRRNNQDETDGGNQGR
jgi:hypothetical protein